MLKKFPYLDLCFSIVTLFKIQIILFYNLTGWCERRIECSRFIIHLIITQIWLINVNTCHVVVSKSVFYMEFDKEILENDISWLFFL